MSLFLAPDTLSIVASPVVSGELRPSLPSRWPSTCSSLSALSIYPCGFFDCFLLLSIPWDLTDLGFPPRVTSVTGVAPDAVRCSWRLQCCTTVWWHPWVAPPCSGAPRSAPPCLCACSHRRGGAPAFSGAPVHHVDAVVDHTTVVVWLCLRFGPNTLLVSSSSSSSSMPNSNGGFGCLQDRSAPPVGPWWSSIHVLTLARSL